MFLCYCSSGTGKEIKALNGRMGIQIKHQEHFFLRGKAVKHSSTLLGPVMNCRDPSVPNPSSCIRTSLQVPFVPIFPMGKEDSRSGSLREGFRIK